MSSADRRAWPALSWREVPWTSSPPTDLLPRSVRERYRGPYRAAVVPAIALRTPAVDRGAAALADEAAAEVARFDAEVGADLVPFGAVLLRGESASSSQIEQLTSSARSIALAEAGVAGKRNAELVVANVRSMEAALALAGRLDVDAVLAMHRALLESSVPEHAGRWRDEQVWVGGTTFGPHGADFVPPVHDDVPRLMDDLLTFARRDDLPVLVHAAVAHAQLETVHPFVDGNGRTGRAFVHALLRRRELTRSVTVPVSAGLLTDVEGYFAALTAYRAGDPSPVVSAVSTGALTAVVNARQLVVDLRAVRAGWVDVVRARRGSATWRLVDALLRRPVLDARTAAAETGVDASNVLRAIGPLVDAGVLHEVTGARRGRVWEAPAVLAALDAFAARTGRRSAT